VWADILSSSKVVKKCGTKVVCTHLNGAYKTCVLHYKVDRTIGEKGS